MLSDRQRALPLWRRSSWAWVTSGAVRIAAAARLWEDIRRAHRYGAVGASPQGALAGLRRLAGRRRDDPGGRRRCGIARARRIAGATASWRRFGKRRTGLPGSWRRTRPYVLESRKGERKLDRKPRRRGGKVRKRGLSREQVPILVAADRAGATLSDTLPALNADSVKDALEPVVARNASLVSDASGCYPPVAAALDIPHEAPPGSGSAAPFTSRRPTAATARSRASRGASAASPPRISIAIELGDQPSAESLSRGRDGQAMPMVCELSLHELRLMRQDWECQCQSV